MTDRPVFTVRCPLCGEVLRHECDTALLSKIEWFDRGFPPENPSGEDAFELLVDERNKARTLAGRLAKSINRWIAQDEYDYCGLGDALTDYDEQSKKWQDSTRYDEQ